MANAHVRRRLTTSPTSYSDPHTPSRPQGSRTSRSTSVPPRSASLVPASPASLLTPQSPAQLPASPVLESRVRPAPSRCSPDTAGPSRPAQSSLHRSAPAERRNLPPRRDTLPTAPPLCRTVSLAPPP